MQLTMRIAAALGALLVAATAVRGQDADPFAGPERAPPQNAAPPSAPVPPPQPVAAQRPTIRLRGVVLITGREPIALIETAGGTTLTVRRGDTLPGDARAVSAAYVVVSVAPGDVRIGAEGTDLVWSVR